jgi:hypothetical protein
MARAELEHLEHIFRIRTEHDQTGLPLARRQEIPVLVAQPNGMNNLYLVQNPSTASAASTWLQNVAAAAMNATSLPTLLSGNQAQVAWPLAGAHSAVPVGQWLLPKTVEPALSAEAAP